MNKNLPIWLGWALYLRSSVCDADHLVRCRDSQRAEPAACTAESMSVWAREIVTLAVLLGVGDVRPEPRAQPERRDHAQSRACRSSSRIIVLLVVLTFVLRAQRFGRHIYAVGGNAEAARRAGINVEASRSSGFVICSTMAAVGGILLASRDNSVAPNTGGRRRCSTRSARPSSAAPACSAARAGSSTPILGGLVVAVIDNGMGLLAAGRRPWSTSSPGLVLLLAASVDALSRRTGHDHGPGLNVGDRQVRTLAGATQEEVRRHNLGALLRLLHVRASRLAL